VWWLALSPHRKKIGMREMRHGKPRKYVKRDTSNKTDKNESVESQRMHIKG